MLKLERFYDSKHNPVYTLLSAQTPTKPIITETYWLTTIACAYHTKQVETEVLFDNDVLWLNLEASKAFTSLHSTIANIKPLEEVAIDLYELLGE